MWLWMSGSLGSCNSDDESSEIVDTKSSISSHSSDNEIGAGESTSTRHRKTSRGDSIAEAIRELAGASREKYKMQATSSRSSSYSISTCMEELKKYADIVPPLKRLKASKELQDRKWRETFICMDEETRLVWFDSL